MKTGSKIQFATPYSTKYTVAKSHKVKASDEFVSKYSIRNTDMLVSIETRPKKKRFKSRLVQKSNQ